MYKINIVCVGGLKEDYYKQAQNEYLKRLGRFCEIKIVEIAENKLPQNPSQTEIEKSLDFERAKILPHLKGKVIVCAVEGKQRDSENFANFLLDEFNKTDTLTFVIGSSYGLSAKLKKDATLFSLSKMTLPHHLLRIVLQEQIYRAFTIFNNITYHK